MSYYPKVLYTSKRRYNSSSSQYPHFPTTVFIVYRRVIIIVFILKTENEEIEKETMSALVKIYNN